MAKTTGAGFSPRSFGFAVTFFVFGRRFVGGFRFGIRFGFGFAHGGTLPWQGVLSMFTGLDLLADAQTHPDSILNRPALSTPSPAAWSPPVPHPPATP